MALLQGKGKGMCQHGMLKADTCTMLSHTAAGSGMHAHVPVPIIKLPWTLPFGMPVCMHIHPTPPSAHLCPRCFSRAASYSVLRLSSLRLASFTSPVTCSRQQW